jgi:hypothetical protein
MPVVSTGPYDTAGYILQLTRSRINDAAQSLDGNLLSDQQPYTFTYLNAAYRHLQRKLTNGSMETFVRETQLLQMPPAAGLDPGLQTYLSFTGFYDGEQMHANPVLPVDMIAPLRIWERQSGSSPSVLNPNTFIPMAKSSDGLPSRIQTIYLSQWEWREDAIWFVGSTQTNDLRLRYNAWLTDLLDSTSLVMIVNCADALAYYTAAEFAKARGSDLADNFYAMGDDVVKDMTLLDSRARQRQNHRRKPYSRGNHSGWGWF